MNNSTQKRMIRLEDRKHLRRLFAFVGPYRGYLVIAMIAVIVGSVLGLAGPYTAQFLIDAVFKENDRDLLNRITVLLIIIFAAQSVFYFIRRYSLLYIGERVMADIRLKLFSHLQGLSLSFFNERRTGELVSRLTNDVSTVRGLVTGDISTALSQVLTFFGALVLIIVTDWRLTLFMLALIPLVMIIAIVFGRRLRKLSVSVQDQLANATTILEESLAGVRVVKSFTREPYEQRRFSDSIERTVELAMKRMRLSSTFGPAVSFLAFSAAVSIFWYGGNEVLAGRLTAGQLVFFLVLTMTIAGSIGQFSGLWSSLQEALGATNRLFEILDTEAEVRDLDGATALPPAKGQIAFEDVSFAYSDHPDMEILKNISFKVNPGEILALVGPSGAGKTTLVNLLPRFYDPTSGRICIDSADIRTVTLQSLRAQIGIVPQEALLFGGSVRENILYGKLEAPEEEMIEAAKAANAHDFIAQLPEGYDSIVGERGVKLSGGQRQRIAIARALLKDPRILLLDEATSSLDSESEALVQDALDRLMTNRTSIVIAHRLSTIQNADRIAVLEEGRLIEIGTHSELIKLDGLYARLHRIQFKLAESGRIEETAEPQAEEPEAVRKRRSFSIFPDIEN